MHLNLQRNLTRKTTPTLAEISSIPGGVAGTRATLLKMRELVRSGKKSLPVRLTALSLIRRNGQKDWIGEAKNLHAFVRDKIRYVKDIRGVETLHTPEKLLELRQGDCDDKSVLLASLLESIGHPTRFVASGRSRGLYCHVLVETKIGNKWIPLETTEPVEMGWYPKELKARLVIHN